MKIIQLLAAIDGESPGTIGSQIYGLGDDGVVYELCSPGPARDIPGRYGAETRHLHGQTGGWKVVCRSDEHSEMIKNPLAS